MFPGRPARLLLPLALGVLVCHAALLADWVVDDAGITFAYARNLGGGLGLVSQPGVEPVEGFSNPLWTFVLAPFFTAGMFHPLWTPKLLSLALLGLSFLLIGRATPGDDGVEGWLLASAPLLLALDASFVVWTTSGLENPLLVVLLVVSATLAFRLREDSAPRTAFLGGCVGGLIALTRPEGAAYLGAFGCSLVFLGTRRGLVRSLGAFVTGAGILIGPYLAFRCLYFQDWVPNTYHAKVRSWLVADDPTRLAELLSSAAGRLAPIVALLLLIGLATAIRRRTPRDHAFLVVSLYLATAGAVYLILPPDWMGEFRFATPFFLFFFWLTSLALATAFRMLRSRGWRVGFAVPVAAMLLVAEDARVNADRSMDFATAPTVPFERIADFGRAYDGLAAFLPGGRGSLLLPDLGGTLFTSTRLRLYDLAGLCDKTVARTLMDDTGAFHDYVFETARPSFIHVHGSWAGWAALHGDPRFVRDYVPLHETWSGGEGGEPRAGDYVRRDQADDSGRLERLRAEFVRLGLGRPLP